MGGDAAEITATARDACERVIPGEKVVFRGGEMMFLGREIKVMTANVA